MIQRIRNLEKNFSLSKAALIVGFFALLSRLVGFGRDMLFASRLGPGDVLDVYYASFRIPDFVFNLLVLGTLSVAFIPVFTEVLIENKERAFKIANTVLNISLLIITLVCVLLFVAAEPLTRLVVPGFTGDKFHQTVLLTRLFLISPIIFTASNIFSSILQSYKKFLLVSLAPILYNLGIIIGLVFFYPRFGIVGWGIGVLAGAVMHALIQIPTVLNSGFKWSPQINAQDPAVKKIGALFVPRIFGLDVSNISLFFATIVGSTLAAGSISIFNLANNLQAVPLGIFALSVAVASFPVFSELFAQKKHEEFLKVLEKSLVQVLFFIIPLSILMLLMRAHIVRLAFGRGQFDWTDTRLTFNAFGIFCLSLFAQSTVPVLARSFYARHNTKIPVIIGLCTMSVNAFLSFTLARHYGVVGLAAGFSAASMFNALALFIGLRLTLSNDVGEDGIRRFDNALALEIAKIVSASIVMGLVSYALLYALAPLLNTKTAVGILIQAGIASTIGAFVYLGFGKILGIAQARKMVDFMLRK